MVDELLDNVLIDFGNVLCGSDWTFKQDNATIQQFVKSKNIITWESIKDEWNKIDNSLLQPLIQSMPRHLMEVINNKEWKPNY